MRYKYTIEDSSIPTRYGFNQKIYCNLKTIDNFYVVEGEIYVVDSNGNRVEDIKPMTFLRVTGEKTTAELESIMPDSSLTIAKNMENVIKIYLLNLINQGEI